MVKIKHLKDQILHNDNRFLYCVVCGGEYSANSVDYFAYDKEHVLKCCDKPLLLMTKKIMLEEVKDDLY